MPRYTTVCPRNCYSTCTMTVEVEDGRLRRIEPHAGNRATAEGPCLKGLSYVERVHSPDRILHPLRRKAGSRGAAAGPDDFERISWDAALDEISERLVRYRGEGGPQSVLYYSASGTKGLLNGVGMNFWRLFGGCTTTYGDLCWPAGLEATRLTLGDNKHNAPWDIENARLIVLWGKNAAETNIHQTVFINKALDAGAKLVVIDPRRTETSERAHLLIQPRPGSDGAIALAVANLLIESGSINEDFISQHVHGYDAFVRSVHAFTPEKAAGIADVPVEYIHRLAEYLGKIRPATINAGFGMQRYTNSGQTMRTMIALLAITGNIGKPGAGWIFANLQGDVFDAVKDPVAFYPPEQPDGVVRVSIPTANLGRAMLDTTEPPLKMAWVERGNPVTQNPDTNQVLEAFRALEFRVVVEQFMTDTAREADIILPAKTMFEQSDICWAYWHPYIHLKQKVLEPPGEVKPETEIYWHLAGRLGIPEPDLDGLIPAPGDTHIDAFLTRQLPRSRTLTLEALREGPVIVPGHQEVVFANGEFPTPSGKIELVSTEARERWGVGTLPDYHEPAESIHKSGGAGKHPFYMMTPNTKNRIHSQFNNLALIRRMSKGPEVSMHPADAELKGIAEGARVRIFNDRGSLEAPARFDQGLRRGCVSITNGWWITEGGTVNFCSSGRATDMGHGAAFHDNLVDVTPV